MTTSITNLNLKSYSPASLYFHTIPPAEILVDQNSLPTILNSDNVIQTVRLESRNEQLRIFRSIISRYRQIVIYRLTKKLDNGDYKAQNMLRLINNYHRSVVKTVQEVSEEERIKQLKVLYVQFRSQLNEMSIDSNTKNNNEGMQQLINRIFKFELLESCLGFHQNQSKNNN